ncbi:MAG: hypothetical protein V7731_14770 [Amphritea sp.]
MFSSYRKKRKKKKLDSLYNYKAVAASITYQQLALNSVCVGVGNDKAHNIVVSLTSYQRRINDIYLTIESLFQQSLRADKILLWLSRDNFPGGYDELPEILKRQSERGLEIHFVEGDLGCYKKIIYTLEQYPDSLIVTTDDDIMYPQDMIDQLYRAYVRHPDVIHCQRAHRIQLDSNNKPLAYRQWHHSVNSTKPAFDLFPTGNGGVLYFPGCFDKEVLNQKQFMSLAPSADDIWLKAMAMKAGVKSQPVYDERYWKSRFLTIENSQVGSLTSINKSREYGNDAKLKAVFDAYNLWGLLPG